jgi:hypothetical protein
MRGFARARGGQARQPHLPAREISLIPPGGAFPVVTKSDRLPASLACGRGTTHGTASPLTSVNRVHSGHMASVFVLAARPGRGSGLLLTRGFRVRGNPLEVWTPPGDCQEQTVGGWYLHGGCVFTGESYGLPGAAGQVTSPGPLDVSLPGGPGCEKQTARFFYCIGRHRAPYGSSSRSPWCSAKSLKSLRLSVASVSS